MIDYAMRDISMEKK